MNLKVRGWITKLRRQQDGPARRRGTAAVHALQPRAVQRGAGLPARDARAPLACAGAAEGGDASSPRAAPRGSACACSASTDAQIDAIARSGDAAREHLAFSSPASGFVIEKDVVEGGVGRARDAALSASRRSSKVWVEADVYEGDFRAARRPGRDGRRSTTCPAARTRRRSRTCIHTSIPKTRTGRVRLELAQQDSSSGPACTRTSQLASDLGRAAGTGVRRRLHGPAPARVRRPRRRALQAAGGPLGAKQRHVRGALGSEAGDIVATSGVFLIAAEARISTAAKYWDDTERRRRSDSLRTAMQRDPAPPDPHAAPGDAPACRLHVPMHPRCRADARKCPKCGMDLVPSSVMSDARSRGARGPAVARSSGVARVRSRDPLVAALTAWGWVSLQRAPLDAIPDLSDVQVIVFTEWMGQSPDLVEDQVTYPISSRAALGAEGASTCAASRCSACRSSTSIFDDGTDIYWARSRVLEYLSSVRAKLPAGRRRRRSAPTRPASAGSSSTRSSTRPASTTLQQLRSLQDWNAPLRARERAGRRRGRERRRLREAVPGERRPEQAARRSASTMDEVVRAVRALEPGGRRPRARDRRPRAGDPRPRLREDARRHRRRARSRSANGTPDPRAATSRDGAARARHPARPRRARTAKARSSAASSSCATARTRSTSSTRVKAAARRDRRRACPRASQIVADLRPLRADRGRRSTRSSTR